MAGGFGMVAFVSPPRDRSRYEPQDAPLRSAISQITPRDPWAGVRQSERTTTKITKGKKGKGCPANSSNPARPAVPDTSVAWQLAFESSLLLVPHFFVISVVPPVPAPTWATRWLGRGRVRLLRKLPGEMSRRGHERQAGRGLTMRRLMELAPPCMYCRPKKSISLDHHPGSQSGRGAVCRHVSVNTAFRQAIRTTRARLEPQKSFTAPGTSASARWADPRA